MSAYDRVSGSVFYALSRLRPTAPLPHRWKRKKGVDYANEIPFEQQPPEGFHETGPEEDPKANLGLPAFGGFA